MGNQCPGNTCEHLLTNQQEGLVTSRFSNKKKTRQALRKLSINLSLSNSTICKTQRKELSKIKEHFKNNFYEMQDMEKQNKFSFAIKNCPYKKRRNISDFQFLQI